MRPKLIAPEIIRRASARPFLKWAGGKSQLIDLLAEHVPSVYGRYIEPFVGGGALFFHLQPSNAVISDSNPELVSCYRVVQSHVESLIQLLSSYPHDKGFYYELRAKRPCDLNSVQRAARFIYLNRTCFNGLHRVNKQGEFNVPFGEYKNPRICDAPLLRQASQVLEGTIIEEGDYGEVLRRYARPGDFVYLDPPYFPVSAYSDFKRYTKEFFYEDDHVQLALEFARLMDNGVKVLLTNSNTEFTRRLYQGFPYEIVNARRSISCNGASRDGQDLVVIGTKPVGRSTKRKRSKSDTLSILETFPSTRYMGSKCNVLDFIWETVQDLEFDSVLDAFSGSGCVSYLFKSKGKQVYSNDLMQFSYHVANAAVANNNVKLSDDDVSILLADDPAAPTFIRDTFQGLYYGDDDNAFLDQTRHNIDKLEGEYKRSLAIAAVVRACLKKRPRGIFTYTGDRYFDNRPDLQLSLQQHFLVATREYNQSVFDNSKANAAFNSDVFQLDVKPDLVYLDPPYYSPLSDSDYVRRYHFVEGLARYWRGVEIQTHSSTKKFRKYPTAFNGKDSTYDGFLRVFEKYRDSIIVVSYSSNSLPSKSELADMLKQYKSRVRVFQIGHLYSFGTQKDAKTNANAVEEYVFIGI